MAARALNKVLLIGNLTRDPELRYTPSGTAVCTFGLATNRAWTTDGEKKEDVEFHRIVAWQKLAEICSKFLGKGRKIFLEGRLQTRTWTTKDGQERQTTEIVINDMIILDSRRGIEERGEGGAAGEPATPTVTAAPADNTNDQKDEEEEEKGDKEDEGEKKKQSNAKRQKENESREKSALEEPSEKEEKVEPKDIPF